MSVLELLVYLSMEPNCISSLSLGLMRAVTLESEGPSVCARFALSIHANHCTGTYTPELHYDTSRLKGRH